MEGRESLLTYSDKKGIDLSLNKRFLNFAKRVHAERIKSTMDVRGGVIAAIALFAILVGIDVILGDAGKSFNMQILKAVLSVGLMLVLAKMMLGSKSEEFHERVLKENFDVKSITQMIATPDEISGALVDQVQR